ncbi:hypothetical protein [Sagittula salina]|uniref:Uncharacterized protein n=1 Tax=Sagittula salina TaxID=2820268 RepID=A0A940RZ05_9RHOB|nr:hypothetical protein [Sagittula salina]MBP0481458.1 hypothetical protein [Sagittula salina]
MTNVTKLQDAKAAEALKLLEQAFEYYTPVTRPESTAPVYETLPLAG